MASKIEKIKKFLKKYEEQARFCQMCPRNCRIEREKQKGNCGEPFEARISSINLHFGEEPPISGQNGSGTIFFSGCNLHCVFCQNYPISQLHQANQQLSPDVLAEKMLELQQKGAHNLNFVTPSHYIFQMVQALEKAVEKGLKIPIVFNSSGYDKAEILADLEGIVDIWLPDMKYAFSDPALRYSEAPNYVEINRSALLEMYRQTDGNLILDSQKTAKKGMIIRHLVIPGQTENSIQVLNWIKKEIGTKVHLSLMSQYFPAYQALNNNIDELNRRLNAQEYERVTRHAENLGFEKGWFQDLDAAP